MEVTNVSMTEVEQIFEEVFEVEGNTLKQAQ